MSNNLEKQILDLFTKNVKKSRSKLVSLDASFQKDLGLDSMRLVGILLQFEVAFGLDISEVDLDLASLSTIRDLVNFTKKLGID